MKYGTVNQYKHVLGGPFCTDSNTWFLLDFIIGPFSFCRYYYVIEIWVSDISSLNRDSLHVVHWSFSSGAALLESHGAVRHGLVKAARALICQHCWALRELLPDLLTVKQSALHKHMHTYAFKAVVETMFGHNPRSSRLIKSTQTHTHTQKQLPVYYLDNSI